MTETIAPSPATTGQAFSQEELQLAFRNRGMPLEAMRHDLTPTGLHYLLIHWDIPDLDPATWRLHVGGSVERPLELSLADLLARPSRSVTVTLECAGNGRARLEPRSFSQPWLYEAIGTAEWTGVPLRDVLAEAGLLPETVELVFTGADHGIQGGVEHDYARSLTVADATRPEVLLAYAMNGQPLEPQHGAPFRLLVPGWYGMTSVKWLRSIEAVREPFRGYQQAEAYRFQERDGEPGEPVSRIRVRALMIPPGFPDFPERRRYVEAGTVELTGRAWSGMAPVTRVEVGIDGEWLEARLDPPVAEHAWRGWRHTWQATPGAHRLSCRATDASGASQPLEQPWNVQGLCNNLVQTIDVLVR
ncbi:MAG TPA: sulfite oxidase [Candidatus Limnocylindrales bacterium]|nr:sulfite oxidase [Candidatus Limnocylindrales bacterium]